jgi:guanine nucleotide-binding protein G(o) subunit alpha
MGGKIIRFFSQIESVSTMNLFEVSSIKANVTDFFSIFREQSKTMKDCWVRRSSVNVIDGHKEYLQDLARIASPTFRPTTQDILLGRVKTTQVVMERYRIDGIEFEMYDVGGQRSERRKWIDCFDQVDAVIFVAALSEYDQTLAESKRTNRMTEALDLFRSVCNNRAFANTSIMLFLNKKDVFAEKIMYTDIAAQKPFADYAGPPREFNSGVLYFIQKFKDCLIDDDFNDSFIHVTCATDTNNMEFVLDSIIMTDNLRRSGFLGAG